jgi:hypothetical protein
VRTSRLELDELWGYVGHKRNLQRSKPSLSPEKGDQYTYAAPASSTGAIVAYRTGKRDTDTTMEFVHDLLGGLHALGERARPAVARLNSPNRV